MQKEEKSGILYHLHHLCCRESHEPGGIPSSVTCQSSTASRGAVGGTPGLTKPVLAVCRELVVIARLLGECWGRQLRRTLSDAPTWDLLTWD